MAAGIVEFSGAGVCIGCRQSFLGIMDVNNTVGNEVVASRSLLWRIDLLDWMRHSMAGM